VQFNGDSVLGVPGLLNAARADGDHRQRRRERCC
jgi:hypothetical protein